jgi:hypothetical protein
VGSTILLIMGLVVTFLAVWVTATKRGYRIGFVRGIQAAENNAALKEQTRMRDEIDNV